MGIGSIPEVQWLSSAEYPVERGITHFPCSFDEHDNGREGGARSFDTVDLSYVKTFREFIHRGCVAL